MTDRVLVIGGSSNLGLATARRLSSTGRDVTIAGRDAARLQESAASLGGVETAVLDITDAEAVSALFTERPPFAHVVVSAATLAFGPILDSDEQKLRHAFDSRVWGAYNVVRHGAPRLAGGLAGGGSLTFFSGVIAQVPSAGSAMVAASAGAIEALVRSLAVELAPQRVNAISPGVISNGETGSAAGDLGRVLPVRRLGHPDDIAAAVDYVISNGFVTGTVLQVNGGHHLAH